MLSVMNDLPDAQLQPPVSPAHSTGTITRRFSKGFQSCLKGTRDDFDVDVDHHRPPGKAGWKFEWKFFVYVFSDRIVQITLIIIFKNSMSRMSHDSKYCYQSLYCALPLDSHKGKNVLATILLSISVHFV